MATRDLTPQDDGNKKYLPNEDGAGVRGNTGDPALDAHTETHDSVLPPGGVSASKARDAQDKSGEGSDKKSDK